MVFPALIVPNRYCSSGDVRRLGAFSGLVEARCTRGKLQLYVNGKVAVTNCALPRTCALPLKRIVGQTSAFPQSCLGASWHPRRRGELRPCGCVGRPHLLSQALFRAGFGEGV